MVKSIKFRYFHFTLFMLTIYCFIMLVALIRYQLVTLQLWVGLFFMLSLVLLEYLGERKRLGWRKKALVFAAIFYLTLVLGPPGVDPLLAAILFIALIPAYLFKAEKH